MTRAGGSRDTLIAHGSAGFRLFVNAMDGCSGSNPGENATSPSLRAVVISFAGSASPECASHKMVT